MSRVIADGLSKRATATTQEAEAGTADKYPDAAGVHAAFNQFGLGVNDPNRITNLDTQFTSGLYTFLRTSTGNPFSQAGTLEVIPFATVDTGATNNAVRQVARSHDATADTLIVVERNIWGKDPVQIGPWREVYTQSSILGTVAQSAGVPTGAIIERGSNANGEYVKFADGTLIMTMKPSIDYSLDSSNGQIFTAPTIPASNIDCSKAAQLVSATNNTSNTNWMLSVNSVIAQVVSTGELMVRVADTSWGSTLDYLTLIAIGRWW